MTRKWFIALSLGLFLTNIASVANATTWNPSDKSAGITLSGGNLVATGSGSASEDARSTTSKSTSKFYYEVTITTVGSSSATVGVADATYSLGSGPGSDTHSAGYTASGFILANSSSTVIPSSSFTTGDIIGVAIDVPNHLVYFSLNGVWQNSAVPASGTGGVNYITTSAMFADVHFNAAGGAQTANFGPGGLSNSPPTGFSTWDAAGGATSDQSLPLTGFGN